MNTSIKNLNHMLAFQLEGTHDMVKALHSDLGTVCNAIDDDEIRQTIEAYRQNLSDQRLKLKRIFGYLLCGPFRRKAVQTHNAIAGWDDILDIDTLPRLRDILLCSSLQLVTKSLVTSYYEARFIAMRLELDTVVRILDEILDSEEEVSQKLKRLASTHINEACLLVTS